MTRLRQSASAGSGRWIVFALALAVLAFGHELAQPLKTFGQAGIQSTNLGSVVACANQNALSPVVGTGAAATFYTCTIPAGAIRAGGGINVIVRAKHTTGTASVAYSLSFGGTSTTATTPSGAANQREFLEYFVTNAANSQSSQVITWTSVDSNSGSMGLTSDDTAAVSTASPVVINAQFNVAATDQITPKQFIVRLVQ